MKNIIKMLSMDKDFRIVIADTYQIAEKELNNFIGSDCIRDFLKQIITNCTLLSAMNDFNQKMSFSLRLSKEISIFCMITNSKLSIEYTNKLNEFNGTVSDLFNDKSLLSITTGDWDTGLHTGTVEAHINEYGHRFYDSSSFSKIFVILSLKNMGMSLSEIHQYVNNNNFDIRIFIEEEMRRVETEITDLQLRLMPCIHYWKGSVLEANQVDADMVKLAEGFYQNPSQSSFGITGDTYKYLIELIAEYDKHNG